MTDPERSFAQWLEEHEHFSAGALLGFGFLLRLWTAHGTFLNPDEALHFQIANQPSWAVSYHASLTTAHPPLLIFILHFWRELGTSEFVLRLPSVMAGTLFCWLSFRWMTTVFGRVAGWVSFFLVLFLPPLIASSAEVRQYALLLLFMSAALVLLEQAFAKKSAADMIFSYLFVLLAMLTHYSALFFAAALGTYSFLRWMEDKYPPGLKAAWAVCQLAILALYDFLYRTHLSRLHAGSSITTQAWLSNSLFHRGQQSLLLFIFARTFGVFQFVFGQLALGDVAGVLFFVGVVFLARKEMANKTPHSQALIALLTLPFALTCAAAIAGFYPYGGTRHSAFLIPFAIAGVSVVVARFAEQNLVRGLGAVLAIVVMSAVLGRPHRPYMTRQDQSLANMSQTMTFLHQNVPTNSVILVDSQTSLLLGYYLCEQQPVSFDRSIPGFLIFRCGGYRVLSTGPETSIFTAESFLHGKAWSVMPEGLSMKFGERFWVMQAGWDIDLARQLRITSPRFRDLEFESFGRNIQMFKAVLEPEGPVSPQ